VSKAPGAREFGYLVIAYRNRHSSLRVQRSMCTCAAERTAKTKAFSTRLQTSAEMRRRAVPRWTSRPLGEPLWGRRKGVPLRQDWGPAPGEGAAGVQIPAIRLHRGSGSRLMPCPAEQAVMAEIFVLTTAGRSPRGIAQQLAERGIMVPGGRPRKPWRSFVAEME
jgi:hypothetical protein